MIIVIEGPDSSGKTTLARQFESRGFHYVHNGVPKPDEDLFEFYTNQVLAAKYEARDVVFDRLHLGEIVYGIVMRGKSLITIEQVRLLNRLIASTGAVTVLCMPKFITVLENWQGRQDREYVKDPNKLEQIYNLYWTLAREYRGFEGSFTVWDYVNQEQPVWPTKTLYLNDGVIGNPRARYLFVGEKAGGPHDLAFYSYERSSHFLNECLWDAGYLEHELAFTNAYTMNDVPRKIAPLTGALQLQEDRSHSELAESLGYAKPLRRAYRTFDGPQTIITLGELAHRRCELEDVEHFRAPHPQYIKRFKSRERWRYIELLKTFRGQ